MTRGEQLKVFNEILEKQEGCRILSTAEQPDNREGVTGKTTVELDSNCVTPLFADLDCDEMKVLRVWALW